MVAIVARRTSVTFQAMFEPCSGSRWRVICFGSRVDSRPRARDSHPAPPPAPREARTLLDRPRADVALAKVRLRDAGMPRDDADALVDLYRRFGGVGFMATITTLANEADAQAKELEAVGATLQATAPAKGA